MLEGLEVSVLNLSDITFLNNRFRIDAEFFKKEYLLIEEKIKSNNYKRLSEAKCEIKHPTEIKREYSDEGVWFFRTQNIRPLKIEYNNEVYISEEDAFRLKNNEIKYSDIVITRTGANFGQTAVYNLNKKAIGSSHTFIVRNKYFNQFYLAVFFNTKYGRKMIDKGMYGGLQPEIAPYYLLNIPIPDFGKLFEKQIEDYYLSSEKNIKLSEQKYNQAENLLLETLQLTNFEPENEAVNIKSLKESFLQTGRLDAEFYQKKYEEIEQNIKKYINGFAPLGEVCTLKDQNFTPKDNVKYSYIELSNIGNSGEITGCTLEEGQHLPSRARRKVSEGDVIISSIEGSLKSCAIIPKEYHNALCSTGFYVISSERINAETLLVIFKSELMQQILKKNCSGTILTAINKEEFLNIPIPIIGEEYQTQIAEYIRQANALRSEAKKLLDEAKLSVEEAIEKSQWGG